MSKKNKQTEANIHKQGVISNFICVKILIKSTCFKVQNIKI
jgi:hypothetical protein